MDSVEDGYRSRGESWELCTVRIWYDFISLLFSYFNLDSNHLHPPDSALILLCNPL